MIKRLYRDDLSGGRKDHVKDEVFKIGSNSYTTLEPKAIENYEDGLLVGKIVRGPSYWMVDPHVGDIIWSHIY